LQSIKTQTYPNIEVIVVDRYSSDNTAKIADEANARVLLMNAERSSAKNHGAKNAEGSFILFLDSDMELTSKVIDECVTVCLRKDVDAVDIPQVSVAQGFLAECRKIEKELYIGDPNSFKMPSFFKKEVFNSVGGFDENLVVGEDFDLSRRVEKAGYKIRRCKTEIKHHEGELSMKKIMLKACYYGKTLPSLIRKNPSLAIKGYSPIRYLRNFKLLLKHPLHFMGLIVMKNVEYMAYLIGILSTVLSGSSSPSSLLE